LWMVKLYICFANFITMGLTFKLASESDCDYLTDTAKKAKQHWGYSDELIEMWHDDLAIIPAKFVDCKIVKAYSEDEFIGFYVLKNKGEYSELDGLWIAPEFHGKGYGRDVMHHVQCEASKSGYKYIELYSDPNVNVFYEKTGGIFKGTKESAIKGRYLNIYHFNVMF